jgi:hypothetical protein
MNYINYSTWEVWGQVAMKQLDLSRRDVLGAGASLSLALGLVGNDSARAAPGTVDDSVLMEYFLNFSETATGFSRSDLKSTGQDAAYFATAQRVLGRDAFAEFLQASHGSDMQTLLSSPKLGPIARNLIKLWYTATWERLPSEWQDAYGGTSKNTAFIVSADAYTTGLLWPAIGANPPGANAPGFGTWSNPPTELQ